MGLANSRMASGPVNVPAVAGVRRSQRLKLGLDNEDNGKTWSRIDVRLKGDSAKWAVAIGDVVCGYLRPIHLALSRGSVNKFNRQTRS